MRAISEALEKLLEDGSWFAREHETRLMVVQVSGDVRAPALNILAGLEFHADNKSAWVILEDARRSDDDGWAARAVRLVANWEDRQKAFKKEAGLEQGTVPRPDIPNEAEDDTNHKSWFEKLLRRNEQASKRRLRRDDVSLVFGCTLELFARAIRRPLEGLVLVFAPNVLEGAEAFEGELELLIGASSLRFCRFVLVLDEATPLPRRLLAGLGDRAMVSDCRVDRAQAARDVEALLAASGPGAPGGGAGAGPRGVTPPRRVDDPPEIPKEQRDELLREAGVEPALIDEGPRFKQLVLGASVAMQKGRGAEAVRLQREARDLAGQLKMTEAQVACQLGLASYLSGLDRRDLALAELESAAVRAREAGLLEAQSQALLARGLVLVLEKKLPEAAHDYALSARVAEAGESPMLAIEGYRMAGQLAEQLRARAQAVTCYREAMRVAEATDYELVQLSSAAEVARRLADVLEKQKLDAQAKLLDERAGKIVQGQFGFGAGESTFEMSKMRFDVPPEVSELEAEAASASAGDQPEQPPRPLEMTLLHELTIRSREALRPPEAPRGPQAEPGSGIEPPPQPAQPLPMPQAQPPLIRQAPPPQVQSPPVMPNPSEVFSTRATPQPSPESTVVLPERRGAQPPLSEATMRLPEGQKQLLEAESTVRLSGELKPQAGGEPPEDHPEDRPLLNPERTMRLSAVKSTDEPSGIRWKVRDKGKKE